MVTTLRKAKTKTARASEWNISSSSERINQSVYSAMAFNSYYSSINSADAGKNIENLCLALSCLP